jgi:16S rRNA (guanine1516-N2)-methyltransferase
VKNVKPLVTVIPESSAQTLQARALAARLELPFALADAPLLLPLLLVVTPHRLELRENVPKAAGPVFVDFLAGAVDHRRRFGGGKDQALVRAVGVKGPKTPTVLDATAGLGKDAFVLATFGCTVHLLERSPVIAALLEDGLKRAEADPDTRPIAARMHLSVGDATQILHRLPMSERPDVVYLDPMYPHFGKTALKGKEMRLFRMLVGDDEDTPELLHAALACAQQRVVAKRPRNAPTIEGPAPSGSIESKNTRYDLYITPRDNAEI